MTTTYALVWDWDRGRDNDGDCHGGSGGRDCVQVTDGPGGLILEGRHGDVTFRLTTDADGAATAVRLAAGGDDAPMVRLDLRRDEEGWTHRGGPRLEASGGALDVDIGSTAATNTLPIRRLCLSEGEAAEIDVLHLLVPEFQARIARQRYTKRAGGYLYENLDSGFSAQLSVDDRGWVTDYPGLCRRVTP